MKQRRMSQNGFTLIELLVAMALLSIIFLVISQITGSMNTSSALLNSKNELTQEAQIVQRLLTGRLSEAIYVFPAGQVMTLSNNGITTKNTIRAGANQQWIVNTDPFIAMILPPEAPTYAAGSNVPNNCTASISDGCYRFYAYYAMRRSELTAAVQTTSNPTGLNPSSVPLADALNPDAWVLMQYKSNLVGWTPNYTNPANGVSSAQINTLLSGAAYQGQGGNLLADYIQPQTNDGSANDLFPATSPAAPQDDCQVFCVLRTPSTSPTKSNDGAVEVRFHMERRIRGSGKAITINGTNPAGGSTSYLGGIVSPRNWWPQP